MENYLGSDTLQFTDSPQLGRPHNSVQVKKDKKEKKKAYIK